MGEEIIEDYKLFLDLVFKRSIRVALFIDAAHIHHSLPPDSKIDYFKMIDFLVDDRHFVRAFYYDGIYPEYKALEKEEYKQKRENLLNFVKIFRGRKVIPRLLDLKFRGNRAIQKGVDVQIAIDMLMMAFQNVYDVAILVSADSDFAGVIRAVQSLGKLVEVAYFGNEGLSGELMDVADKLIDLSKHINFFKLEK